MLRCQKDLFSLDNNVHYINCAYMAPLLKSAENAGIEGLIKKRNPFNISPEDFFTDAAEVRALFAKLVNADAGRIALIPSVSYGMGIVMKNIKPDPGKNIITIQDEFPSDVYALQRICEDHKKKLITIEPPEGNLNRGKEWNQRILEAITKDTALVNLSSVHWADGTVFNVEEIGTRAKEVGALFVVDGTQSVGALDFDVKKTKVDALFCSGYKWLMGPYTSGYAYLGEAFDNGKPIEESWLNRTGSSNFRDLVNYQSAYYPLAGRYNMGESSNFINLPIQKAALSQLLAWTTDAIQAYCKNITHPLIKILAENDFGLEESDYRSAHLFGCRLPAHLNMETIQQQLSQKNVIVSVRGNAIRLSPHLYNDQNDIDQLQAALVG